jgi:hypothetical protein
MSTAQHYSGDGYHQDQPRPHAQLAVRHMRTHALHDIDGMPLPGSAPLQEHMWLFFKHCIESGELHVGFKPSHFNQG